MNKTCFRFINFLKKVRSKETIVYCKFLLLCIIMWVNLFYMHYEVYLSHYTLEKYYQAVFYWWLDVIVSVFVFYICTLGRLKLTCTLSYIFLGFFVLANTIYSRFFEQYISLDVLSESSNFQGTWWIKYVPVAFRWTDLLLIVTTAIFFFIVKTLKNERRRLDGIMIGSTIVVSLLIYTVIATRIESRSLRSYEQLKNWICEIDYGDGLVQNYIHRQELIISNYGVLLTQVYCNIECHTHNQELSSQDISRINSYLNKKRKNLLPLPDSCNVTGKPNIIFILVESYMSIASTTKIDGQDITPNINSLMKEEGTYSNLMVNSNKGEGASSDAQVSYLTGLIPLKSEMAVLHIIKDNIIAFPKLLHDQKGYNTYITIPTGKYFWHQNEANTKYGIDNVIEAGNEGNEFWCDDEELFKIVERKTSKLKKPYMNIILTLSMHGSYEDDFLATVNKKTPFKYPKSYSQELCHYLDKCYYTDAQIGNYIRYLKKQGQYGNSVLIICSDHQTNPEEIRDKSLKADLPLIIANTRIPTNRFHHGRMNQVDLFPTMLDMFGVKSDWRGLGHSILRKNYSNRLTQQDTEISSMIIRGNYFNNKQ